MSYNSSLIIRQTSPNLKHTTDPAPKTGSLKGRTVEQVKPESTGFFGKIAKAIATVALPALAGIAENLLNSSLDHEDAVHSYAATGYFPSEK